MKYFILPVALICSGFALCAQKNYPEPEFVNEVYYLKKDSVNSTIRLEKSSSRMETRNKAAGFGGFESNYEIEGAKSPVRFSSGNDISFVFSTGASASAGSTAQRDSMMRANGVDPSMMESSMHDPTQTISLYKTETSKDKRKVLLQKNPGMMPFASKKMKSADKLTFSIRKIRSGYWELVIDKALTKGEYAFTMMNTTDPNGGVWIFAFAID